MSWQTLINAAELASLSGLENILIVDCRADLGDPGKAARDYANAHLPGAVFASVDLDLSDLGKKSLGRHPLPDAEAFSKVLGRWGWTPRTQVVAYDAANGALSAARLWWMLRLVGHRDVAVLDGGFGAWTGAGLPLADAVPLRAPSSVSVQFDATQIVYTGELLREQARGLLIDARAAPRYRGEVEPIDPVAGHVPGAINRPFSDNLLADGRFKAAEVLHAEFAVLIGDHEPGTVMHMCGSGVTACHNLLAMEHAGLAGSRVYAPSWSGWISDSTRAVERAPLAET